MVFKRLPPLAGLLFCVQALAQCPAGANCDESKVGSYTLPDPLVFQDGKPVKSAKDWKKRREELIGLFQKSEYGRNPKPPKGAGYEIFDIDRKALGGKAIRKQVRIDLTTNKGGPAEDVLVYVPADAVKPVPVILAINFSGNQAVINDPGIKLPVVWNRRTGKSAPAAATSRGTDTDWQVEQTLKHGYGFATVYYQQIDPDFKGGMEQGIGIRALLFKAGQTEPAADDWGAIGAWAYGLSRAMDYLEKDNDVDSRRVAVMGHSRLGKTALWTGAIDTRFAMVLASCSGEGGASLARRNYGETTRNLVDKFPYWFCRNFQKYADHSDQLPIDAHELIALSAPRPVYITSAEQDLEADPQGMFLACVAAGPVYKLLGAQDLGADRMPGLNQPVMHTLGFHYRTGKHEVTAYDWDQFLKFADMHFRK
jgi:hypothetical protein